MIWKISCHVSAKDVMLPDRGMRKVPHMCICMSSGHWDTLLDWMAMSGAALAFKCVEADSNANTVLLAKWHDERGRGCAAIMYTLHYRAIIILGYTYKYASLCACTPGPCSNCACAIVITCKLLTMVKPWVNCHPPYLLHVLNAYSVLHINLR